MNPYSPLNIRYILKNCIDYRFVELIGQRLNNSSTGYVNWADGNGANANRLTMYNIHDVIINEEDCGTLRGLVCTALKNNDEVIATLYERILGRVSVLGPMPAFSFPLSFLSAQPDFGGLFSYNSYKSPSIITIN